jgi:hypothetical protein
LQKQNLKDVLIAVISPTKAFFVKEKQSATRDLSMIIYIFLPFIYGFLGVFLGVTDTEVVVLPQVNIIYMMISAVMLIGATYRSDSDGQTIIAALPFKVRDLMNAKIRWFVLVIPPAFLLPCLLYINTPLSLDAFYFTLIWIGFGPIMGIGLLMLKVRMFGKLRYKYVLDEIQKANKVAKWFIMGFIGIAGGIVLSEVIVAILANHNLAYLAMIFLPIEAGLIGLLYLIYNYMFPKSGMRHSTDRLTTKIPI